MAISNAEIKIAPEVSQFLAQPRKLLIDGQWVAAAAGEWSLVCLAFNLKRFHTLSWP